MPNVGDTVRYLNDVGGGRIVRIQGTTAWVIDDEGFENPVLLRECVVVRTAEQDRAAAEAVKRSDPVITTVAPPSPGIDDESEGEDDVIEEIDGADRLNITVGFEPVERNKLSVTDFDASLINDSNYYLYFAFSTRANGDDNWTCRYAGMVEPNTELWMGTFGHADVERFDNINLQYVSFKRGRAYEMKSPGNVDIKVDTTQFHKLHYYRHNPYFDNEVIAFDFVKDDKVYSPDNGVDLKVLRTICLPPDKKSAGKPARHRPEPVNLDEPLVVDLHIDELVDTRAGLSSADMLNLQVDTFRRIMNENLRNFGRKIIFIHGKGEGVLRHALLKELTHRYSGHDVQDASFREYGFGATQVTIRQNPVKPNKKAGR